MAAGFPRDPSCPAWGDSLTTEASTRAGCNFPPSHPGLLHGADVPRQALGALLALRLEPLEAGVAGELLVHCGELALEELQLRLRLRERLH
eukprot:3178784-Pyramimonas_sp.AAC.1